MKKLIILFLWLCFGKFNTNAQTNITAAEYFFDTDPGVGNGIAVALPAGDTVTTTLSLPASFLSNGRHLFCFRTKDDLGKWSLPSVSVFLYEPKGTQVTTGEYFYDTDPGFGNAIQFSLGAADTILNTFSLPASGLTNGRHMFCMRIKDNAGNWGQLATSSILAEPKGSQLINGEYFFDTDPGMGNATAFAFAGSDTINSSFSLAIPSITLGLHTFCLRMKDNAGNWGMNSCHLLQVVPLNTACTDAEYYFDTDPGPGNGSLLGLNLLQDTIDLSNTAVPVSLSMTTGTHYLFIRSRNNGSVYSLAAIDTFDVTAAPVPVNLLNFTAHKAGAQVILKWQTNREINNLGFEVLRSDDGFRFSRIGWVAGMNTSHENNYVFTDQAPFNGKNFYRLNQVDQDHHTRLSEIRKIDFQQPINISIYPNPASDLLHVQLINSIKSIKISDVQGRMVWEGKTNGSLQVTIPIQNLPGGTYLLEVTDVSGNRMVEKFVKASQ